MLAKLGKSILQRTITYQRRGLSTLRHAVILMLGTGLASAILVFSGHNPFIPQPTHAILGWFALEIISALTDIPSISSIFIAVVGGFLTSIVGLLMVLMMSLAVAVASYDVVINTPNVILAWKVLRDVVNLFFVIILLVIAIGTTLRREQYMWNKNLPRFIIAAIFVNFSRTIVAFVTDFADVIQQTFTSGFTTTYFAKFVASFGITFFLSATTGEDITFNGVPVPDEVVTAIATVIALVMEFIVMAIMFVYFALFLVRVVGLWLIAIFGPVAFVSSILPQTQKYYKDWWSKLANLALIGPMLAFFMWLGVTLIPDPATGAETFAAVLTGVPPQIGAAGQPSFIIGFCLMTIVMYFGMQQAMGLAGDFGAVVGKAQSFAFGTMLGGVTSAAAFAGKDLLSRADYGQMRLRQAGAKGLQGALGLKEGSAMFKAVGALGAGGTFSGLRRSFTERAQERQKARQAEGDVANKQLATTIGTWPVLKAVEKITGRTTDQGAIQGKVAATGEDLANIAGDNSITEAERVEKLNKKLTEAQEEVDKAQTDGKISGGEHAQLTGLLDEQRRKYIDLDGFAPAAGYRQNNQIIGNTEQQIRQNTEQFGQLIASVDGQLETIGAQIAAQEAIVANPATTPAQLVAAQNELQRLNPVRDGLVNRRQGLETQRDQRNREIGDAVGLDRRRALQQAQEARKAEWLDTTRGDLRQRNAQLMEEANRNMTGGNFLGRALVNLGTEAGTQQYEEEKARRDNAIKGVERLSGGDKKSLVDLLARAMASKDVDKAQAILNTLTKNGDIDELSTNARALPMMQQLLRNNFTAAAGKVTTMTPEQRQAAVDAEMKKVAEAPDNPAYRDLAIEQMFREMYGGDEKAVAKVIGNLRSARAAKYGAAIAQTFTDANTGETKLIGMNVQVNADGINVTYKDKAKKAYLNALRKMKPGEMVSHIQEEDLFTHNSDGQIAGVSPLAPDILKVFPPQANEVKFNNLNSGVAEAISKNKEMFTRAVWGDVSARENRAKIIRMAEARNAREEGPEA